MFFVLPLLTFSPEPESKLYICLCITSMREALADVERLCSPSEAVVGKFADAVGVLW